MIHYLIGALKIISMTSPINHCCGSIFAAVFVSKFIYGIMAYYSEENQELVRTEKFL